MKDTRTVYVTKYALTDGVKMMVGYVEDRMFVGCEPKDIGKPYSTFYIHQPDWHDAIESAIARAEIMRVKKLESLRKSITKIEALDFLGAAK